MHSKNKEENKLITFTIATSKGVKTTYGVAKTDIAKKKLLPVIQEMRHAQKEKREPQEFIDGVSYDTASERKFLIEIGALVSENDDPLIN